MKQWIKLETDIMYNHGVRRLYAEHRMFGVGIYIVLRLYIESLSDDGIPYEEVLRYGNSYASRNLVVSVLEDYDLFSNWGGIIKPMDISTLPTGATTGATTGTTTDAHEPIQDENRKEKSGEKAPPTEEEVWKKEFRKHYPTLARMSEPLTLAQYKKLLDRYPNEMIINKLERMDNMTGFSRKYKSTYRVLINWLKD